MNNVEIIRTQLRTTILACKSLAQLTFVSNKDCRERMCTDLDLIDNLIQEWTIMEYTQEEAHELCEASQLLQKSKEKKSHSFLSVKKLGDIPLTLDELKKMNDERVYLRLSVFGMYALVSYHAENDENYDTEDGADVWLTNNLGGRDTYDKLLAMGGVAYRLKPKTIIDK